MEESIVNDQLHDDPTIHYYNIIIFVPIDPFNYGNLKPHLIITYAVRYIINSEPMSFISAFTTMQLLYVLAFLVATHHAYYLRMSVDRRNMCVRDLKEFSAKQMLSFIANNATLDDFDRFDGVDVVRSNPTVNKYVVANPKAFLSADDDVKRMFGVDVSLDMSLESLAPLLPVIYIADTHPQYGTLGFLLNRRSPNRMSELFPSFKSFRDRPIHLGGMGNKGSTFTMMHKIVGFPENRPMKRLPGASSDFRLFFSPDVAMANEMCSTADAKPADFKFFQFATIWQPRELDAQYEKKLWLTFSGPSKIIFDDNSESKPIWRRVVASLPSERLA